MDKLIDKFWDNYVKHRNDDFVCNPSIPIIWFGDMNAYFSSKIKIVSVSINPSKAEFERTPDGNFKRFKNALQIVNKDLLDEYDKVMLKNELNSYFKEAPYTFWFNKIEKVLTLLNASFFNNKAEFTALHIDIFSALATDPVYGKLTDEQRRKINSTELLMELLEKLTPDIILCSFNHKNFMRLLNSYGLNERNMLDCVTDGKLKLELYKGNNEIFIFGSNMKGSPFTIKREILTSFINRNKSAMYSCGF